MQLLAPLVAVYSPHRPPPLLPLVLARGTRLFEVREVGKLMRSRGRPLELPS
jgi:hypothetical protein